MSRLSEKNSYHFAQHCMSYDEWFAFGEKHIPDGHRILSLPYHPQDFPIVKIVADYLMIELDFNIYFDDSGLVKHYPILDNRYLQMVGAAAVPTRQATGAVHDGILRGTHTLFVLTLDTKDSDWVLDSLKYALWNPYARVLVLTTKGMTPDDLPACLRQSDVPIFFNGHDFLTYWGIQPTPTRSKKRLEAINNFKQYF